MDEGVISKGVPPIGVNDIHRLKLNCRVFQQNFLAPYKKQPAALVRGSRSRQYLEAFKKNRL
uniref:Uncharacterized protein n=1 Tax=Romanomermis culicivorax TaxID=13658 RepID=A0A915KA00_ROMCU